MTTPLKLTIGQSAQHATRLAQLNLTCTLALASQNYRMPKEAIQSRALPAPCRSRAGAQSAADCCCLWPAAAGVPAWAATSHTPTHCSAPQIQHHGLVFSQHSHSHHWSAPSLVLSIDCHSHDVLTSSCRNATRWPIGTKQTAICIGHSFGPAISVTHTT